MPPITAIVHTHNDGLRLGRALESLRPCDEIIVVDHASTDDSLRVAREYGAIIRSAGREQATASHFASAQNEWILCVLPSETLTETLEASLYEWKASTASEVAKIPGCAMTVKQETRDGWKDAPRSTRLVPRGWTLWDGELPVYHPDSLLLDGDLLRFQTP
jgi:cellulose synthase/poly-beta-1,6-N-acetylglucosamine synthase-like glycosyltransferase